MYDRRTIPLMQNYSVCSCHFDLYVGVKYNGQLFCYCGRTDTSDRLSSRKCYCRTYICRYVCTYARSGFVSENISFLNNSKHQALSINSTDMFQDGRVLFAICIFIHDTLNETVNS